MYITIVGVGDLDTLDIHSLVVSCYFWKSGI